MRKYLEGDPEVEALYGGGFRTLARFEEKAAEVDGRFDREARAMAARAMVAPEGADPERLSRWVEDGVCW